MAVNGNNTPLSGGDSESFMRLMSRALSKIEQVDRATNKANDSLQEYAETFDALNEKLAEYIQLSHGVKSVRFKGPSGGGRSSSSSSYSSSSGGRDDLADTVKNLNNKTKKALSESSDLLFDAVNSLGGKYSAALLKNIKPFMTVFKKSKTVAATAKEVGKYSTQVLAAGKATSGLTKVIAGLGSTAGVVGGVVAGLVVTFGLMEEAGKVAYERNVELNKALMQLGASEDELKTSTSDTAKTAISAKNTWSRIGDDLTESFEPFYKGWVEFSDWFGKGFEKFINLGEKKDPDEFKDSRVRWYTKNKLEDLEGEPEKNSLPVISSIASSAKQSGFSNSSATNLAINTYDRAMILSKKYGIEASEVAKKLGDAWLKGSDAAKEFGVVVDDQTLDGFMISKNVDIVNTKISDAMKQYYRFQLLQEETSADNSDYMQDNIKKWKQLGMQIEDTKGRLFSFDEVIQLSATDTTIPDIDKNGEIINTSKDPYNSMITYPGVDTLPDLTDQLREISDLTPIDADVNVDTPGSDKVDDLKEKIAKTAKDWWATITSDVPGLDKVKELWATVKDTAKDWWTTIRSKIPGFKQVADFLNNLYTIAKTWVGEIDFSVIGHDILEKAVGLLQRAKDLLSSMGQGTVQTGHHYVDGFYNKTNLTHTTSILSRWAPSSAEAYGGGLKGALKADLDLNLTRLGLKKSTREGYTTQDLRNRTAEYIGYNANPFNKNSWAQLSLATAAAGLAAKYGAVKTTYSPLPAGYLTSASKALPVASAASLPAKALHLLPGPKFADGGIGTREINNATLFENNKKEAIIPLESSAGVKYLSDALQQAGRDAISGGDSYTINLTISGINLADDDSRWEAVGRKIAEVIDVQRRRRGDLNYGSTF